MPRLRLKEEKMADKIAIGIVCSHPKETKSLSAVLKNAKKARFSLFRGMEGMLGDKPCIVIESGMGGDRAYAAVKQLIPLYEPEVILDFGAAAALSGDFSPGDLVAVNAAMNCSAFLSAWKKSDPFFNDPAQIPDMDFPVIRVPSNVTSVFQKIGDISVTDAGCADHFIESETVRNTLQEQEIGLFDYETWSVFQASKESGVLYGSLRVITDKAGKNAVKEFRKNAGPALNRAAGILPSIVAMFCKSE